MTIEGEPRRREPWDTVGERAGVIREFSRRVESGVESRVKARVETFNLLGEERSQRTQGLSWRAVELSLRKIGVDPLPLFFEDPNKIAIAVSNYPSVSSALKAAMRLGASLFKKGISIKGVGRPEVITQSNLILKALGIDGLVFPATKDAAGSYKLEQKVTKGVLAYLDKPGSVLWMSITGDTNQNGLGEADVRTGAAGFSSKKGVPLVPMGIVTKGEGRNMRAIRVKLGEPIPPPVLLESELDQPDYLIDYSKMLMTEIARLLPPGQRGDFEDIDKKLSEARRRLGLPT